MNDSSAGVTAVQAAALELKDIHKFYGDVRANDGVSFKVNTGRIHGIVGENGAGKSTAMKLLYGMQKPDSGEIILDGINRSWHSPMDAIHSGIGMVHQHFMLALPNTALDNVLLGEEWLDDRFSFLPRLLRPIHRNKALEKLKALQKQYGLEAPLLEKIENLPVGIQQRVEILKLLYRNARILILDEPTAVLTPQETDALFDNLKKLKKEGKTILLITHKLREVMQFTDEVTVFRAGKVVGSRSTSHTSEEELAELMVGRKVVLRVGTPPPPKLAGIALDVGNLSDGGKLKDISLRVQGGEIVGIAGVEGNGQSELLKAILAPCESGNRTTGSVHILGQEVTHLTTSAIRSLGVAVLPEDRHKEAMMLEDSVEENFLLGHHKRKDYQKGGILLRTRLQEAALNALEEFDVRPRNLDHLAGHLSGGNQQKLVIARELHTRPKLIIAAQPTRGVDVGAIEFIHMRMINERSRGVGVLLISSELEEVLSLSDRVLVMYGGKIVAEFSRTERPYDQSRIGLFMGGGQPV